jgi:hypothetical protein
MSIDLLVANLAHDFQKEIGKEIATIYLPPVPFLALYYALCDKYFRHTMRDNAPIRDIGSEGYSFQGINIYRSVNRDEIKIYLKDVKGVEVGERP